MRRPEILFLLPFVLMIGCGTEESTEVAGETASVPAAPQEDTAEAALRYVIDGIKNGQPVVAWNSLPESYQKDVNELVRGFGEKMDPEIWKEVTGLLSSVQQILIDKQQFIVNHPGVAGSENPEVMAAAVPQLAGLLKTVLDSTGNLESLKTFDGGEFMKSSGVDLVKQFDALSKLAPPEAAPGPVGLAALDNIKIETVSTSDSTATLKTTGPNGEEQTMELVRVEEKWLPKEMVDGWEQQMAAAREALDGMPDQMDQARPMVAMITGSVKGMLTPLQSAADQEQFNSAVNGVQQMAMGLMMQQMGGGNGTSPFGGSSQPATPEVQEVPESQNTPPAPGQNEEAAPEAAATPEQ